MSIYFSRTTVIASCCMGSILLKNVCSNIFKCFIILWLVASVICIAMHVYSLVYQYIIIGQADYAGIVWGITGNRKHEAYNASIIGEIDTPCLNAVKFQPM